MIRTDEYGRLRAITLDRPDRRNALTRGAIEDLETAVQAAEEPVIYLSGAGPAFCAGADLETIRALDGDGPDARAFAQAVQSMLGTIESTNSIVVAGVDGAARGGGVELCLAADLRLATPEATFAEPGVSMGIFGAWGGTRRLPDAVGESHALALSLTGRTIDAAEARDMGLVSRVVDDPRAVAEAVADHVPAALRTVKHLLRDRRPRADQEAREADAFADLLADGIE